MSELTRLTFRKDPDEPVNEFPDDVARLKSILNARGFDASDRDIILAYETYSEESWAAGWMSFTGMPDEAIFDAIRRYLFEDKP